MIGRLCTRLIISTCYTTGISLRSNDVIKEAWLTSSDTASQTMPLSTALNNISLFTGFLITRGHFPLLHARLTALNSSEPNQLFMLNHSVCSSTYTGITRCATQTASHAHSAHVCVVESGWEQRWDFSGHIQQLWISEVGVCDAQAKQQDTIMVCLLTARICVTSSVCGLMLEWFKETVWLSVLNVN